MRCQTLKQFEENGRSKPVVESTLVRKLVSEVGNRMEEYWEQDKASIQTDATIRALKWAQQKMGEVLEEAVQRLERGEAKQTAEKPKTKPRRVSKPKFSLVEEIAYNILKEHGPLYYRDIVDIAVEEGHWDGAQPNKYAIFCRSLCYVVEKEAGTRVERVGHGVYAAIPPSRQQNMSHGYTAVESAVKVLREEGGALHYRDLAKKALKKKYWKSNSVAPEISMLGCINQEIRRDGIAARIRCLGRGYYTLN